MRNTEATFRLASAQLFGGHEEAIVAARRAVVVGVRVNELIRMRLLLNARVTFRVEDFLADGEIYDDFTARELACEAQNADRKGDSAAA